jgi:cell division protein FtsI/penicillin-binding protein 2
MACAIGCIANGGSLCRPYLLDRITDSTGSVIFEAKPEIRGSVSASREVLGQIAKAMERTVASGTGKAAAIPGVRIAGKTGSAQAAGGPAHGWFVCYAPCEDPKIAIACIVERGASGSGSAAPVAKAVLESYFEYKKGNE